MIDTPAKFSSSISRLHPSPARAVERSSREAIKDDFRRYLLEERGLSESTVPNMSRFVDQFLAAQFPDNHFEFATLGAPDITEFVTRKASELRPGRTKLLVVALRGFLRYLRYRGQIETDLAACVPAVPGYSLTTLPKSLPPGSVERVLKHCDRSISQGRRDYAIVLLLARLGFRGGEVIALTLDDIDWDLGQITIKGKGGRTDKLPLPADAGAAIAQYLRRDRPRSDSRTLFLRLRPPFCPLGAQSAISTVVKRALKRAGIRSKRKGAHLFRHTLATGMLQRGASLGEIGEILRHRNANTTRIYAKVDLLALRKLAMVWPGGAR